MKSFNALEYIKLTDSLKNYYIISGLQQNQASRGCDGKIHLSWNSSCLETGDQRWINSIESLNYALCQSV